MASNFFSNMFSKNSEDGEDMMGNGPENHAFSLLQDRVRTMQKLIEEITKRLEVVEEKLSEKEKESEEESVVAPTTIQLDTPINPVEISVPEPPKPQTMEVYLAAPSADGSFPSVSSREQIGKSIYVLSTQDGMNGTFSIIDSNDAIATAMISISQFLKPVCKVNGSTAQYPHHIITDEVGTASKEGGLWKVVRKAIVHFE